MASDAFLDKIAAPLVIIGVAITLYFVWKHDQTLHPTTNLLAKK